MGVWGMGLAQSDEFCEVYERFMEAYDEGEAVPEIEKAILDSCHAEFDDADGVMHNVYFALAKAEWMCCAPSERILHRVQEIIKSDADLEFYRELGASPSDVSLRAKKLEQFWQTLQTPRKSARKRRPDPSMREKPFPELAPGDCFAYKYGEGRRVLIILDRFQFDQWCKEQVFCCVLRRTFAVSELSSIDYLNEEVGCAGCYLGVDFPGASTLRKLGSIPVPPHARNQILGPNAFAANHKSDFKKDYSHGEHVLLRELLSHRATQRPSP